MGLITSTCLSDLSAELSLSASWKWLEQFRWRFVCGIVAHFECFRICRVIMATWRTRQAKQNVAWLHAWAMASRRSFICTIEPNHDDIYRGRTAAGASPVFAGNHILMYFGQCPLAGGRGRSHVRIEQTFQEDTRRADGISSEAVERISFWDLLGRATCRLRRPTSL